MIATTVEVYIDDNSYESQKLLDELNNRNISFIKKNISKKKYLKEYKQIKIDYIPVTKISYTTLVAYIIGCDINKISFICSNSLRINNDNLLLGNQFNLT